MEVIRHILGGDDPTPNQERDAVTQRLDNQAARLRLARIDAGLPVDRRRRVMASSQHRRADDV